MSIKKTGRLITIIELIAWPIKFAFASVGLAIIPASIVAIAKVFIMFKKIDDFVKMMKNPKVLLLLAVGFIGDAILPIGLGPVTNHGAFSVYDKQVTAEKAAEQAKKETILQTDIDNQQNEVAWESQRQDILERQIARQEEQEMLAQQQEDEDVDNKTA